MLVPWWTADRNGFVPPEIVAEARRLLIARSVRYDIGGCE